jgi:hypothetical protein
MNTLTQRPSSIDVHERSTGLRLGELAGIAGLGAIIAIHTSELSGKIEETAYLGFGYLLLVTASTVAIVLIAQRDVRGWVLGGVTALATFIGFVLTRTTGLPAARGDIGNWSEKIGIWSLVAEGVVVVLAAVMLLRHQSTRERSFEGMA